AILTDLLRMYAIPDTGETRARVLAAYLRHLPGCLARSAGKVLPGVRELLGELQGRADVAVGLLTGNVRAGAKLKLSHLGLFDHFAFGGYGDAHPDRDDVAREALAEVERHLKGQVNLERIWVIGDTPHDIRCARAIGARAVAVTTGWHSSAELAEHAPDL